MKWKIVNEISNETRSQHKYEPKKGKFSRSSLRELTSWGHLLLLLLLHLSRRGSWWRRWGRHGLQRHLHGHRLGWPWDQGHNRTGKSVQYNEAAGCLFFCNNDTSEAGKTPWENLARTQLIDKWQNVITSCLMFISTICSLVMTISMFSSQLQVAPPREEKSGKSGNLLIKYYWKMSCFFATIHCDYFMRHFVYKFSFSSAVLISRYKALIW